LGQRRALAVLVALLALSACGESVDDPEDARCLHPAPTSGAEQSFSDHREVEVHFTCEGAVLAGTLYLPGGDGPNPAVVWVHGSGESPRLEYEGDLVPAVVQAGIAFFSYDKRGVGESEGVCCPGDDDHFNLLAADVAGAVNTVASRSDIDPDQIGVLGASQAGWVVPLAVARFGNVAFTGLVDAPVVSTGEEGRYSELTGEEEGGEGGESVEEATAEVRDEGPSGFDPRPFLRRFTIPGLWLYGGKDLSTPTELNVAVLKELKSTTGKDFTFEVFPGAGHGLLDVPPTDPDALPMLLDWMLDRVHVPGP
jgi:uncharacterized protein